MINVGDTVHVTDDALKMNGGKHRKEFKVTKISRDSFGNQWIHGDAPFEIWNTTELEECTLKFKVGDKVRIVGNTMEKPFSHYLTIGDTATVDRIDANDDVQTYYVLSSDGVYQWVTEKDIEKAEEKAMKFKVGDKVKIVGNSSGHFFHNGDIVTVTAIGSNYRSYDCDDNDGSVWRVAECDIEKVEEKAMKFKVGDKVTIKSKAEITKAYGRVYDMPGSWVDVMDEYCGKTGEIIGISNNRYRVDFGHRKWTYGYKAFTPPQPTVTITFSGDTTIATDGEHTATVTKYHGDEYSEEAGAIEAIKKLYHRFPQKGDVVYFVGVARDGADVGSCRFDDTFAVDRGYRESGNLYETKEAAQKAADKINAIFKEEH